MEELTESQEKTQRASFEVSSLARLEAIIEELKEQVKFYKNELEIDKGE